METTCEHCYHVTWLKNKTNFNLFEKQTLSKNTYDRANEWPDSCSAFIMPALAAPTSARSRTASSNRGCKTDMARWEMRVKQ
jgi:hypothetical protein